MEKIVTPGGNGSNRLLPHATLLETYEPKSCFCFPAPEELRNRIATRTAKVGVIGLGYVGLPLALLFTEENLPATGFDIDTREVKALGEGGSYIFRIPAEQIQSALRQGFSATSIPDSGSSTGTGRAFSQSSQPWGQGNLLPTR